MIRKKAGIVLIFCALFLVLFGCGEKPDLILQETSQAQETLSEQETEKQQSQNIFVYICGEVKNPGVYELPSGSRIYQLVEKAGGMKKKADAGAVNLAEALMDGQMIRIPGQSEPGQQTVSAASESTGSGTDGKININTASREQLMTLAGIGETKADQIIAYRTDNGAFQKIEDIMQVAGIKEGLFEKIKECITVQ